MVPNIAMDNTVEKHIKALALNGASEWEPNGQKCIDWDARKQWVHVLYYLIQDLNLRCRRAWRKGAAKRDAKKARQLSKPVALGAFQVFDLPPNWFEFQDGVEDDPTYEDSDVELIPRPIQRARRRRRRAGQVAADVRWCAERRWRPDFTEQEINGEQASLSRSRSAIPPSPLTIFLSLSAPLWVISFTSLLFSPSHSSRMFTVYPKIDLERLWSI